jgi:hypothetical protein
MTSKGALASIIQRCRKVRTYREWKTYVTGELFGTTVAALAPNERPVAVKMIAEAHRRCAKSAPIPYAGAVRVKAWDDAMIAKLRDAEKRFGNDDLIARHLRLPIKSVRTARWKYCGPRRSRTGPHTQNGTDAR